MTINTTYIYTSLGQIDFVMCQHDARSTAHQHEGPNAIKAGRITTMHSRHKTRAIITVKGDTNIVHNYI